MAKKRKREIVKMQSSESSFCYSTVKNKTQTPKRLELNKYDPIVRKHVLFKEAK